MNRETDIWAALVRTQGETVSFSSAEGVVAYFRLFLMYESRSQSPPGDSLHDLIIENFLLVDVDTRYPSNVPHSPSGDSIPLKQFEDVPRVVLLCWFENLVSTAPRSPSQQESDLYCTQQIFNPICNHLLPVYKPPPLPSLTYPLPNTALQNRSLNPSGMNSTYCTVFQALLKGAPTKFHTRYLT
ncbi:hypothetical protein IQ07DRAFT_143966 [Pyrenochaeta sp. DS3sAY3a]|nr:hypothetical protein IQ07DRAFT_143966 [Pyrenochaeta sp. DS3sAY3a]